MAKKSVLGDDAAIYQKRTPQGEKAKLKGLPFKKKLQYIKDYYLKASIVIGITAFVVVYLIYTLVRPKDEVLLRLIAINDSYTEEQTETLINDFGKTINYNPDKEDILIEDNLFLDPENMNTNVQDAITIYTTAGTLDVIIADEDVFTLYAKNGYFCDLSELFSEEELTALSKDLLYATGKHAYGVCLDDSSIYTGMSTWYKQQKASGSSVSYYIGIISNSKQKDNAVAFIEYLKAMK